MPLDQPAPTADQLEAAFAPGRPMAIGLEEEVMLLETETLDLAPIAREVVEAAPDGARRNGIRGGAPGVRGAPHARGHRSRSRSAGLRGGPPLRGTRRCPQPRRAL